ncbi:ComEA family DNA-binding protein [Corynebacterium sp. 4HC-13]|nr:ComEA family DNA-binding protein [Corynebacterium anserum]
MRQRIEALVEPMPEHEVSPVDFERRVGMGPITARAIVGIIAAIALAVTVVVSCGKEKDSTDQLWGSDLGMTDHSANSDSPGEREVASETQEEKNGNAAQKGEGETDASEQNAVVSVQGMVRSPGLLSIAGTARVGEVIQKAGGELPDASLLHINLAEVVVDGMQIVVDREGSTVVMPGMPPAVERNAPRRGTETTSGEGNAAGSGGDVVNINTADATTLQTLDGVGPATAEAIIKWREANGDFSTVEQLMEVRGIGPAKFEAMKDHVTV